jgi:hypothetical protein
MRLVSGSVGALVFVRQHLPDRTYGLGSASGPAKPHTPLTGQRSFTLGPDEISFSRSSGSHAVPPLVTKKRPIAEAFVLSICSRREMSFAPWPRSPSDDLEQVHRASGQPFERKNEQRSSLRSTVEHAPKFGPVALPLPTPSRGTHRGHRPRPSQGVHLDRPIDPSRDLL